MKKLNWFARASGICFAEGESVLGGATAPDPAPAPASTPTPADTLYPAGDAPKPEGDAPAGDAPTDAPKEGEAPKPEGEAPPALKAEDYKWELPEGVTIDAAADKSLRDLFTSMGATQENASALIKMHTDALTAQAEALTSAARESFTNLRTEWRREVDAMPEFSGSQRETNLAILARGIEDFAPGGNAKAVKDMFDSSGMGDNPQLIGLILNMAKALAEGAPTPGGRPGSRGGAKPRPTTLGGALYPDQA